MAEETSQTPPTTVPTRLIGPVAIRGSFMHADVMVPMATYETPLWPSTARGARVTSRAGGILAAVVNDRMTRSILVQATDADRAATIVAALTTMRAPLEDVVAKTSRFARLIDVVAEQVGNLLYIRFAVTTGDASGHNMATLAAEAAMNWLISTYPGLTYISLSANYCSDKKVSAVNGILGRGKHIVAETVIPEKLCRRYLKATPREITDINIKKNLVGSVLAGGVRTANAHFANMLLAVYLATGQDAANIIEGSQGIVFAEVKQGDLYFSVTLPNIIVGTVGNGKDLAFARENLEAMGCLDDREPGLNARRLAVIVGCTVLCGELSLIAALTNPGELMRTHGKLERAASRPPRQ